MSFNATSDLTCKYLTDVSRCPSVASCPLFSHITAPGNLKKLNQIFAVLISYLVLESTSCYIKQVSNWTLHIFGMQVFVSEQILYDKDGLHRHMHKGDSDGPLGIAGFKGHPLCRYADLFLAGLNVSFSLSLLGSPSEIFLVLQVLFEEILQWEWAIYTQST